MDLVSELQALQFLKPANKRAAASSVTWGKPRKALAQPITQQAEMPAPRAEARAEACPDTARRLRIRALAAGAVA